MSALSFTLVSDGSSDRALMPVLRWLLTQQLPSRALRLSWADLRYLRQSPRSLRDRMAAAIRYYPCDLMFVHRDAEGESWPSRRSEIEIAVRELGSPIQSVPIIPVRMMEAWLLFDERAIRLAAGNPNGTVELPVPPVDKLESLPDPKAKLQELLIQASELRGRRRAQFPVAQSVHRLADVIETYAPLRRLTAFQALEAAIATAIAREGWIAS